jgi:hypothetical protein
MWTEKPIMAETATLFRQRFCRSGLARETCLHRSHRGQGRSYPAAGTEQMSALTEILVIEPGRAERHYWRDLWRYRELLYVLAWRDGTVRYMQTVTGLAWALIQPLASMVVFTTIFGRALQLTPE